MAVYDAIVIGSGGVGSAALSHLARRGGRVLGIDRFRAPHDRGSSHGQSRIVRQAYFEHDNYVPLLVESYRQWAELETLAQKKLVNQVGVLQIGPVDGIVVPGVLHAAMRHGLKVEQLSAETVQERWPALRVADQLVGVLEVNAGYLAVESCIEAHLRAAQQCGAELRYGVEVHRWDPSQPLLLHTSDGELRTRRLIITPGAWAGDLLADLPVDFQIRRKSMFWYAPKQSQESVMESPPVFLFELPEGIFYGLPQIEADGVKLAEHSGGQIVEDPLTVDREVFPDDAARIEAFLSKCLPHVSLSRLRHEVCLYTMTPDEHFIVDRHPDCPDVVFAAGLSGHGFKFAPVLGQALADLALESATELPIEFLSLKRFDR